MLNCVLASLSTIFNIIKKNQDVQKDLDDDEEDQEAQDDQTDQYDQMDDHEDQYDTVASFSCIWPFIVLIEPVENRTFSRLW